MSVIRRNYLVVVIILFVANLFVFKIEQTKKKVHNSASLSSFPLQINTWRGQDIELSERIYQILETKDVIMRQYEDEQGDFVNLVVVYAEQNRGSFHPPEYCYVGGGAELVEKGKEDIELKDGGKINTNRMVMRSSKGGTIRSWHWFMANDKFTSNFYLQQLHLLKDIFKGKNAQGALVRVSIRSENPSMEVKAKSFMQELAPVLEQVF